MTKLIFGRARYGVLAGDVCAARRSPCRRTGQYRVHVDDRLRLALFLAKDRGFFKQAGIDPTLTLVGISATLPAALFAGSFQIGATTATAFLQAVDGGLDLVAVGNTTLSEQCDVPRIGLLDCKSTSGINGPHDLVGKKMSVAGIGSGPYVLVRKWLIENKVDIKSIQYIETAYPSMGDALAQRIGRRGARCGAV